jgi:hypothetical protein
MASDKDGVWVFIPRDQLRVAEPLRLAVPTEAPKKENAVDTLMELWKEETSFVHPAPSFTEWLTQPLSSTYRMRKLGTSRNKKVEYCQVIDVLRKERNAGGKCCLMSCDHHLKLGDSMFRCKRCPRYVPIKRVDFCCYCHAMTCMEQKIAKL